MHVHSGAQKHTCTFRFFLASSPGSLSSSTDHEKRGGAWKAKSCTSRCLSHLSGCVAMVNIIGHGTSWLYTSVQSLRFLHHLRPAAFGRVHCILRRDLHLSV